MRSDSFLPTTSGNFNLQETAPAINEGNPDTVGLTLPSLDLGDRVGIDAIIDIGSYENCPLVRMIDA